MNRTSFLRIAAFALALSSLAGCVPVVVVGAAAGGAMVATDRRTTGTQVDDESIELKVAHQAGQQYGDRIHLNVPLLDTHGLLQDVGREPRRGTQSGGGAG